MSAQGTVTWPPPLGCLSCWLHLPSQTPTSKRRAQRFLGRERESFTLQGGIWAAAPTSGVGGHAGLHFRLGKCRSQLEAKAASLLLGDGLTRCPDGEAGTAVHLGRLESLLPRGPRAPGAPCRQAWPWAWGVAPEASALRPASPQAATEKQAGALGVRRAQERRQRDRPVREGRTSGGWRSADLAQPSQEAEPRGLSPRPRTVGWGLAQTRGLLRLLAAPWAPARSRRVAPGLPHGPSPAQLPYGPWNSTGTNAPAEPTAEAPTLRQARSQRRHPV